MPIDTSLSSQIYLSRDNIRTQITEFVKTYLELENVDLTKSSFLTYIVDVLSTLTSNILFYQTSVYKEFFLTKAQLPETIFELSAFLGYNISESHYATAYALLTFPLEFTEYTQFIIPENFRCYAGDIEFRTFYNINVQVSGGNSVSATMTRENKMYDLPVTVDTNNFYLVLPVRQYKITTHEYQIDTGVRKYQFTSIDLIIKGKISNMYVNVFQQGSSAHKAYTEFKSLYLMSPTDYGYVSRRTDKGRKIFFGNGLIGVQPSPGSKINIVVYETLGQDGNVITGSIKRGDRIYTTDGKIVNYSITNTSPATGGRDEESIEDIRKNSIANITSLNRLVSENDYVNANVVMNSTSLGPNSIAVLKRSDISGNEIQLYTSLMFDNEVVPTRNIFHDFTVDVTYVPRGTILEFEGNDYYTIFDMEIDHTLNKVATYKYIIFSVDMSPALEQSYISIEDYNLIATNCKAYRSGNSGIFELYYNSTESDFENCTCEMEIQSTGQKFNMINNSTAQFFYYEFSPYTLISDDTQRFLFTISHPIEGLLSQYAVNVTFRKNLNQHTLSNLMGDSTAVSTVYDIPCIKKLYYDDLVANEQEKTFEVVVLQNLMETLEFKKYRMLTDFVNLKFTNATGLMTNMLRNSPTKPSVISRGLINLPDNTQPNDRYIMSPESEYRNQIAHCTGSDGTTHTWIFFEPASSDIIWVQNENLIYMYTESGWISPLYNIPLKIEVEVYKTPTYTGSDSDLSESVKNELIEKFSPRFGSNITLYRWELIDVINSVDGVKYGSLVEPKSNIYFNFNITSFSQQELLEYSPEYVFFTKNDIIVRVF